MSVSLSAFQFVCLSAGLSICEWDIGWSAEIKYHRDIIVSNLIILVYIQLLLLL